MSGDSLLVGLTRRFRGAGFVSLLRRLPRTPILLAAVLSLLPPLVFKLALRSDLPAAILFPAVLFTTGLGVAKRLAPRRWLRLLSYCLIIFFALITLIGLLITPYSAYLVWMDLLRAGAQRGAVSSLFTMVASVFSATIAPMVFTTGCLWPVLLLGLVLTTLLAIMIQSSALFALILGLIVACLGYLSLARKPSQISLGVTSSPVKTERRRAGPILYPAVTLVLTLVVIVLLSSGQDPRQIRLVNQRLHPSLRRAVVKLFPGFPLIYGIPGYGYSYSQSELGDPPSLSSRPIFEVSGPAGETLYLRTEVFDTYDGSSWSKSSSGSGRSIESIRPPFRYGSLDDPSYIRLTLSAELYSRLPHTIDTVSFRFPERRPPTGTGNVREGIVIDPPLKYGDTVLLERGEPLYRQRIDLAASRESGAGHSGTGPGEVGDRSDRSARFLRPYLQVPMEVPREVRQLARQLSGDGQTVTVLQNIDRYINVNQKYSLNPKRIGAGDDFVWGFLFDTKEGFCVHFATSFVVLARLNGIPARYVTGFLVYLPPDGSPATATGHAAHAWPEVWVEGEGWVHREATHALDRESYEEIEDGLLYEYEMELDRETSRQIEAVLGSQVRDRTAEADGAEDQEGRRSRLLGMAGALAIVLALIVITAFLGAVYLLRRARSRSLGVPAQEVIRDLRFRRRTSRLVRRLRRLGVPAPTEGGWLDWSAAVQRQFPQYGDAARRYCDIVCAYLYGGQELESSWVEHWKRLQSIS
jgi:transglutaminase-like putative cysteine protease